jgi:hypothetical protein
VVCCVAGLAVEPILAPAYLIRAFVLLGLPLLGLYRPMPVVVVLGHSSSQQPVRHLPAQMQDTCEHPTDEVWCRAALLHFSVGTGRNT